MYLIIRKVGMQDYLTAYLDEAVTRDRFAIFSQHGPAFMLEVDAFEYCNPAQGTSNGLILNHPSFNALVADYKAKTVSWDSAVIDAEIEQAKVDVQTAINQLIDGCYQRLHNKYSQLEVDSFIQQEREARKLLENVPVENGVVMRIAALKKTEAIELAARILEKAEKYEYDKAELLIQRHELTMQLREATSLVDLAALVADINL